MITHRLAKGITRSQNVPWSSVRALIALIGYGYGDSHTPYGTLYASLMGGAAERDGDAAASCITEWDMVQPFNCFCGSQNCLGLIAGSQDMEASVLSRYWLNPHVKDLLAGKQMTVAPESTEEISLKA
ncbi:unnamed protein product [Aspergillus oryzae]|nr:unnamed protein product [Aspergillus oryzae]GMF88994.1 unnamed protein product [Aspergillus oryzae]